MASPSKNVKIQANAAADGASEAPVLVEHVDGAAVLTFNRPAARNAVDVATMEGLDAAVSALERDKGVRAVVVTGAGQEAFVSGGDLKDLDARVPSDAEGARALSARMDGVLSRLGALEVPVIAAVNGYAYGGGCEVLVACDYRIGEMHARLAFRQARMGLTTGWGGAGRLLRLVRPGTAMRLLLTAEAISADEAMRIGLLDEVVPTGASRAAALDFATRIGRNGGLAVRLLKRVLRAYQTLPPAEAARFEREAFGEAWASEDHREAVRAFREKRPALFRGR